MKCPCSGLIFTLVEISMLLDMVLMSAANTDNF